MAFGAWLVVAGVLSAAAFGCGVALVVRAGEGLRGGDVAAGGISGALVSSFAAVFLALILGEYVFGAGFRGCYDECHRFLVYAYAITMVAAPVGAALGGWLFTHSVRGALAAGLTVGSLPWIFAVLVLSFFAS